MNTNGSTYESDLEEEGAFYTSAAAAERAELKNEILRLKAEAEGRRRTIKALCLIESARVYLNTEAANALREEERAATPFAKAFNIGDRNAKWRGRDLEAVSLDLDRYSQNLAYNPEGGNLAALQDAAFKLAMMSGAGRQHVGHDAAYLRHALDYLYDAIDAVDPPEDEVSQLKRDVDRLRDQRG